MFNSFDILLTDLSYVGYTFRAWTVPAVHSKWSFVFMSCIFSSRLVRKLCTPDLNNIIVGKLPCINYFSDSTDTASSGVIN